MPLTPIDLRCNDLVEPLAVAAAAPRLSWRLDGGPALQTAWQVQVADDAGFTRLRWDSGRQAGDACAQIAYGGPALAPAALAWWRVRAWDEAGQEGPWSAATRWGAGLARPADWQSARWIRAPQPTPAVHLLRRDFASGAVRDARLYLTARGIVTTTLNGRPVGDEVFAPGWTDYRQRLHYRCHDVTALVRAGANCLAARLGEGWWCGPLAWDQRRLYGRHPELLCLLRLEGVDGAVTWIASDGEWRTADGGTRESSFLNGEHHDAGLEIAGWELPGFAAASWEAVRPLAEVSATPALLPHPGPPVRRIAELPAGETWSPRPGAWIVDLGQNFAGRVRLRLRGLPAGRIVRLRHAEILTPDRRLYVDNLRSAASTDFLIARGEAVETWEPWGTFHGFRYVELTGLESAPAAGDVTGIVLASDVGDAGHLRADDPRLERLVENIRWTQRANFIDVPTDCPQRDERLGWTGDAQAFCRTAAWMSDVSAFFGKWLDDLADAQADDGCLPNVAPNIFRSEEWGPRGDAAWGDAGCIVPWTMYQVYGDRAALARHLPMMRRWVEYCDGQAVDGRRRHDPKKHVCFGDWLSHQADTHRDLIMTAFLAHSAGLARDAAAVCDDAVTATAMGRIHQRAVAAFRRDFVGAEGTVQIEGGTTTQTACLLALRFGLVEGDVAQAVARRLAEDITARDHHLSTGFVGLPYLLPVLSDTGRDDLAWRLLLQDSFPGWLYSVVNGATTIWERWNGYIVGEGPGDPNMNSYAHYAYGSVGEWLFGHAAGIQAATPGFTTVRIAPHLPPAGGPGLGRLEARHRSPRGDIRSAWRREGPRTVYEIDLPPNLAGEACLPLPAGQTLCEDGRPVAILRRDGGRAVVALRPGRRVLTAG